MNGPSLVFCEKCHFGYAGEHTEEDCQRAIAESAEPCDTCGHGKHFHGEGFCVQAIAGGGGFMPSFCGRHEYVPRG